MEDWYVYSGVSSSGQSSLWQNRYRHEFVAPEINDVVELEYIESTGTQWIDMGVTANPNTRVVLDGYLVKRGTGRGFFGVRNNNAFNYATYCSSAYRYAFHYQDNTGNAVDSGKTCTINSAFQIDFNGYDKNYAITTGGSTTSKSLSSYTATQTSSLNMYLFTYNNWGETPSTSRIGIFRLYSCKVYDGQTLIRDFIPALDYNLVPCLYEKITETYFYNNGTGHFNYSLGGNSTMNLNSINRNLQSMNTGELVGFGSKADSTLIVDELDIASNEPEITADTTTESAENSTELAESSSEQEGSGDSI